MIDDLIAQPDAAPYIQTAYGLALAVLSWLFVSRLVRYLRLRREAKPYISRH